MTEAEMKAMMQRVFAMSEEEFGRWCAAQWKDGPVGACPDCQAAGKRCDSYCKTNPVF
jgi:hypothetical protein